MIILGEQVKAVKTYSFSEDAFAFKIVKNAKGEGKIQLNSFFKEYPKRAMLILLSNSGEVPRYLLGMTDEEIKGTSKLTQNLSISDKKFIAHLENTINESQVESKDFYILKEAFDKDNNRISYMGVELYEMIIS